MNRLFLLALASLPLLGGCATLGRMARVDPAQIAAQDERKCPLVQGIGGGRSYAIDLDCYRFPGETALPEGAPPAATAYQKALLQQTDRNRLEAALLKQADSICEIEKGYIFANEATLNTAFDMLASGLSTASTIVGGEQAKSILSGLAGLSTASKSHVTANVYKNQIVPAITNVMDAERTRILTDLIARRQDGLQIYSIDEVIRQVNLYHQACSFQNGVQILLKASVNKAGQDAIIRAMNLRFGIAQLKEARAALLSEDSNPPADSATARTRDDYDAKIREMTLQMVASIDAVGGDTSTASGQEGESAKK